MAMKKNTQKGFSKVLIGFCIAVLIIIGFMVFRNNIIKPGANLGLVFGSWRPSAYLDCFDKYGTKSYLCNTDAKVFPPECKDNKSAVVCNAPSVLNPKAPAKYCTYATVVSVKSALPPGVATSTASSSTGSYQASYLIKRADGSVLTSGITALSTPSDDKDITVGSNACFYLRENGNGEANGFVSAWLQSMAK